MARIFVVDDDRTMVGLLLTLLQLEGHEVEAEDPQEDLLERLRASRPDVILMDVHLRQADGIAILRQLRNDRLLLGVPVIMTSGLDMERECLAAGADSFLMKPYDPSELTELVRGLAASRQGDEQEGTQDK
jgi:CheY-like chemotaxis protein